MRRRRSGSEVLQFPRWNRNIFPSERSLSCSVPPPLPGLDQNFWTVSLNPPCGGAAGSQQTRACCFSKPQRLHTRAVERASSCHHLDSGYSRRCGEAAGLSCRRPRGTSSENPTAPEHKSAGRESDEQSVLGWNWTQLAQTAESPGRSERFMEPAAALGRPRFKDDSMFAESNTMIFF